MKRTETAATANSFLSSPKVNACNSPEILKIPAHPENKWVIIYTASDIESALKKIQAKVMKLKVTVMRNNLRIKEFFFILSFFLILPLIFRVIKENAR